MVQPLVNDYEYTMTHSLPIVAIVTHHANELLLKAIESLILQQQWYRELWVIHSHDVKSPLPDSWNNDPVRKNIQYHWLGSNSGFASAVNHIFATASGPVYILNDDIVLQEDNLEILYNTSLQSPNSILQPEIWLFPEDKTSNPQIENTGHYIGVDGSNTAYGRGLRPKDYGISKRLCFSGAAFWVPESVYKHPSMMKMDTALSPFGEDLDYALRAVRYGFDIYCVHDARLYHRWGGSYDRFSTQKVQWVESHRIQSKFRNLPVWMWLASPLASAVRYGSGLQDDTIPSSQRGQAILSTVKGIWYGYTALPQALRKRKQDNFVISDWEFTKRWWKQS